MRKMRDISGNSPQYDDKNMLGNIGDLLVKCMRQVTKGHLVSFRKFGKGHKLDERSLHMVLRTLEKSLWVEGGNFFISPYYFLN